MSAIFIKIVSDRVNSDVLTNTWYILEGSSIFIYFFPIDALGKFLKVKCNPTNKKSWPDKDIKFYVCYCV